MQTASHNVKNAIMPWQKSKLRGMTHQCNEKFIFWSQRPILCTLIIFAIYCVILIFEIHYVLFEYKLYSVFTPNIKNVVLYLVYCLIQKLGKNFLMCKVCLQLFYIIPWYNKFHISIFTINFREIRRICWIKL